MYVPVVSILLPVYNSARYLAETLESLLAQSFTDFEILAIDDGSTDNSAEIIARYNDQRIRYFRNEKNEGLIYTLNRGISLAAGKFLARMDADDIALPARLQKQTDVLNAKPEVAVVACTVQFIDGHGTPDGFWEADSKCISYEQILQRIPKENCIAHPTVMLRTALAQQYGYNPKQLHAEDYDLWLRLLSDGFRLEKLAEPLLLYRVHSASITGSILRKSNPFFKQYRCKSTFLLGRVRQMKWGSFENRVLASAVSDGMLGLAKAIKNKFLS